MTTPPTITRHTAAILLALAAAFTLTACQPAESACAAAVAMATPPEPIEDGTYRDGTHDDSEIPPEPIEDGSYRDDSEQQAERDQAPPEPIERDRDKPGDDAKGC